MTTVPHPDCRAPCCRVRLAVAESNQVHDDRHCVCCGREFKRAAKPTLVLDAEYNPSGLAHATCAANARLRRANPSRPLRTNQFDAWVLDQPRENLSTDAWYAQMAGFESEDREFHFNWWHEGPLNFDSDRIAHIRELSDALVARFEMEVPVYADPR